MIGRVCITSERRTTTFTSSPKLPPNIHNKCFGNITENRVSLSLSGSPSTPKMTSPTQKEAEQPILNFEIDDSLADWNVPQKKWLTQNSERLQKREIRLDGLATGNLVFNHEGKVLLIQRAPDDSMPNRWEIPGGGVDDEDPTILYGAARELWEESGLKARRYTKLITEGAGGRDLQVFPNSKGTRWFCRFSFLVDVESCEDVGLDPKEHQDFLWASKREIEEQKTGKRDLPITNPAMRSLLLEAFRLRREK
jgi:8-oxo-dGTP pyrophosphatase MutT (NUDIX family)